MNEDKDKMKEMSFAELLDTLEVPEPYRFPYEDYKIIGDTGEIDKIIYTPGIINLDVADVASTLSAKAVNYLSGATANGERAVADAFAEAIDKLPIKPDSISKMLFQIWLPRDAQYHISDLADMLKGVSADIDICWGIAYDELLAAQQARVTLLAASKS